MCMSSTPTAPVEDKPVEYLHNPFLDGATINGAGATQGRNSLRIDLATPTASGVAPAPTPGNAAPFMGNPRPTQPLLQSAGMVVPTIGGSLAGTLPPSIPPGSSGAIRFSAQ
jgi:hypothetical protein